jgi:hypothetical protein
VSKDEFDHDAEPTGYVMTHDGMRWVPYLTDTNEMPAVQTLAVGTNKRRVEKQAERAAKDLHDQWLLRRNTPRELHVLFDPRGTRA